jgi:uncharacterized membrane protein
MLFIGIRILSLIFFFISDLLWVKPIKSGLPNYQLIFIRSIFTAVIFSLTWYIGSMYFNDYALQNNLLKSSYPSDPFFYILATCLCVFSFGGLFYFTSSLRVNKFSFIAPLASLGFVFTIVTSFIVSKQAINSYNIAAILLFGMAIIIVGKNLNRIDFKVLIIPIILTHFFWDTAVVFYPMVINKLGVIPFCLFMEGCVLGTSLVLVWWNKKTFDAIALRKHIPLAMIMSVSICLAVFFFSISLITLSIPVVITLGLATKAIRLGYGYIFLKERLNKQEIVVLIIMIIGGVLASL